MWVAVKGTFHICLALEYKMNTEWTDEHSFKIFMMSATITESVEAHQRSFDRGIQIGHQRRNKVGPFLLRHLDSQFLI